MYIVLLNFTFTIGFILQYNFDTFIYLNFQDLLA